MSDRIALIKRLQPFPELFPDFKEIPPEDVKEYSVDDFIDNAVGAHLEADEHRWVLVDDRFIEDNAADHSSILARISDYRSAIIDLEATRIRAALGYSAALAGAQAEHDLELARYPGNQAVAAAAKTRLINVEASVEALRARHELAGSALNFTERRTRLEDQLKVDIAAAYDRGTAVLSAIKRFSMPSRWRPLPPLPKPGSPRRSSFQGARFFDDWLQWNRLLLEHVEYGQTVEKAVEGIMSLGNRSRYVGLEQRMDSSDPASAYPADISKRIVQKIDSVVPLFKEQLNRGEISFTVRRHTAAWPFDYDVGSYVGLRALGLSVTLADDQQSKWRFGATLILPDGTPVFFQGVGPNAEGITWSNHSSLYNRATRGKWTLKLHPNPSHSAPLGTDTRLNLPEWPILDIQIYVRAAAWPPYPGGWDPEPEPQG